MEKLKADIVVKGNILCKGYISCDSSGHIIAKANLDNYDISEAEVLEGDVVVADDILFNGVLICTGGIAALKSNNRADNNYLDTESLIRKLSKKCPTQQMEE